MTKVITIQNNKGGNAKTTTTVSFATILAMRSKKVLIVDLDPQGNCANVYGINSDDLDNTIYDVLLSDYAISNVLIKLSDDIDLLPSNADLDYFDIDVLAKRLNNPERLLKAKLDSIKDDYDYVLIDTPSYMGLLTMNAMSSADSLAIPFVPDALSVKGVVKLINRAREFNNNLAIAGIFPVIVEARTNVHNDLMDQMASYCTANELNYINVPVKKEIQYSNAVAYQARPVAESSSSVRAVFRDIFDRLKLEDD